ncbi:MAG: hypothetical protein ACTSXO_06180 [Candidatus Heimdallarchaeota archaeon]
MGLKQIWILEESGTCLFHKKYDNNTNDENLVSGFLSAVNSFVGIFDVEIKWIETNKFRFVFKMSNHIIFVACTDTLDHAPLTYKRLVRIADQFHLLFKNEVFNSGDPIPIDIFRKIEPTVSRIFGLTEEENQSTFFKQPIIANSPKFQFNSNEARLISFIRYKRRVTLTDIIQYLKISERDAEELINLLEQKHYLQRFEELDGSERFGLHPFIRSIFR